jgi:hypothetical protein
MKTTDMFILFVGIGWLIMATLFLISLFPAGQRLLQRLELRLKPGAKTIADISRFRRVVFILFCGLYAAVGFASAFERSFSSPLVVVFMILLPSLDLLMRIWDRQFKSKHQPDASENIGENL